VQPAAGDAGTALGAALAVDLRERQAGRSYEMRDAYLGPEYSNAEIQAALDRGKLTYRVLDDPARTAAQLLADGKIIGWFQGRMEFGPRALGARSLLATPTDPQMLHRLNDIKDREDFRPVAPSVLEEAAGEWFEGADYSPFMLFVFDVREDKAHLIPAVRHVDGTARIQTVNERQMPLYHRLIREFGELTGVPVVINTSFNIRGQPIVCTPQDAIECFFVSPLDALVMGNFLIQK
jgi:carbamoyltransferase